LFVAISINSSGQTSSSANLTFSTLSTTGPPPNVGYLAYWGINNTGITVSWSTDVPASTQLAYGTTTALGQLSPLQTTLTASHGVVLTGLNPGTLYYFQAQSTGANGATGYSTLYSLTTTGMATPGSAPIITSVAAINLTGTTATITWTTDQASSSLVNYGMTSSYGSSSTPNTALVTSHSLTISGLTPNTTYNFDVVSTNAASLTSTSSNYTFTTLAATGTAPYVGYLAYWGITDNGLTVSWSTDLPATTQLVYGTTPSFGSMAPVQTALTNNHGVVLTGLNPGTTYYFQAQSTGANGVTGTSSTYDFTTLTP
jgi:phosphodiesterase/alkaline phosphatase D-like protein